MAQIRQQKSYLFLIQSPLRRQIKMNIEGELYLFRTMNIKPNFSELERLYGVNRHTISKYWKNGGKQVKERKKRMRYLDKFYDEIVAIVEKPGVTRKAAHEYMCDKYGQDVIGKYSTFRTYVWEKGIKVGISKKVHVRYETEPADQLQVDWKENMKLHTKNGEELTFNILSSTLGYSRLHIFMYSRTKTTEDFLRCVIETLRKIGGCPKHILTDNMTSVVSITNGTRQKHKKIISFEKDTDIEVRLCKIRTPETKGKDESSNRFLNWLLPYDYQIENEDHLIELIERLNKKVNNEVNQTTSIPPIKLFEKEKEYLKPLPNNVLLDNYIETAFTQEVPQTLLISYKGNGYSVPAKYIGKRVKIYPIDQKLYIYFNTELISIHEISNKKFNYHKEDYRKGILQSIDGQKQDIDKIVEENLRLLDKIGES